VVFGVEVDGHDRFPLDAAQRLKALCGPPPNFNEGVGGEMFIAVFARKRPVTGVQVNVSLKGAVRDDLELLDASLCHYPGISASLSKPVLVPSSFCHFLKATSFSGVSRSREATRRNSSKAFVKPRCCANKSVAVEGTIAGGCKSWLDWMSNQELMEQRISHSRAFSPDSGLGPRLQFPIVEAERLGASCYYVPYTEDRWATMLGILEKIRELRKRIHHMLSTGSGWAQLAAIAGTKLLLPPEETSG
jgi:hypothetical protein